MRVLEWLNKYKGSRLDVTFLIVRAVKDEHTPFYHAEYRTTVLQPVRDWIKSENKPFFDSIILNDNHPTMVWLSGVDWNNIIKRGLAKCLLIVPPEDFAKLMPSPVQRADTEHYCEKHFNK